MKNLKQYLFIGGCAASLVMLTGCIAGLAAGGYGVYAATESKSHVKATFDQPVIVDTNSLKSIQSLAIWPQSRGGGFISDTVLAEMLSSSNVLRVVTPMAVLQVIQSNSLPQSFEEMTSSERSNVFKTVLNHTDADALFFASLSDTKMSYGGIGAAVGIQSASSTQIMTLLIYSKAKNEVIWQDAMEIKINVAAKSDGMEVMQQECTEALAKRIVEITSTNITLPTR